MWKIISRNRAFVRAISIISALSVLVTGVTFAALQSQQVTLTGNSIQTATAGLLIGTASATSSAYSSTHTGFTFSNVVPGGSAMPADGYTFYLKNTGNAALLLKMSIGSTPTNTSNVDLSKVNVNIVRVDNGSAQSTSLQSLLDGYPSGGLGLSDALSPASTGTAYKLTITMNTEAFSGTSASISGIDFVFSGTAQVAA